MDGTIDLNLLRVFVAVAEASSFSAAGARLGMPTSSVSRAVAALEAALGVQLLHRTTRRVSLSTAGEALLARVAPGLAALEEAVGNLPEQEEQPSGELRITAPVDLGTVLLSELVARFAARHPAVRIDVHLTNRVVDLVAEGFDLALRVASERPADASLRTWEVSPIAGGLFASPSYLARRGTPRVPADLHQHDWVGFRGMQRLFLTGPEPAELELRGHIVSDDMLFVRQALLAGAGIGYLPRFDASALVAAGDLAAVLPRWSTRPISLWIVEPARRHVPRKVEAFRAWILDGLRLRPIA